jgi:outer membrane protein
MMKNLLKIALVPVCVLLIGNIALAQVKIGYINFAQLAQQMPETKQIGDQINAYSKQFMDQLTSMDNDYKAKLKAYNDQRATMTDAVRIAKEGELGEEQKRLQDYSNTSQQQVEAKTNELAKPLFDKVRAAIAQVAKEKGYTYVINAAQVELIVSPPGDDLTADVKAKLGIK